MTAEADAPLSVAVGLIVRQQLTGRELPPSAENVVQYWREHVLESAGEHIEALRDHVGDQAQFGNLCRNIIADLGLPMIWMIPWMVKPTRTIWLLTKLRTLKRISA